MSHPFILQRKWKSLRLFLVALIFLCGSLVYKKWDLYSIETESQTIQTHITELQQKKQHALTVEKDQEKLIPLFKKMFLEQENAESTATHRLSLALFLEGLGREQFLETFLFSLGPEKVSEGTHFSEILTPLTLSFDAQDEAQIWYFLEEMIERSPYLFYINVLEIKKSENGTLVFKAELNAVWWRDTGNVLGTWIQENSTKSQTESHREENHSHFAPLFSFEGSEDANEIKKNSTSYLKTAEVMPTLGGIFYQDATHWTIWIDGVAINPHANPTIYKVKKIGPEFVTLAWQQGESRVVEKTLRLMDAKKL